MNQHHFIAKTFAGLEQILADELVQLGAENVQPMIRGVSFYGDKKMMYRANYQCRTALSILFVLKTFPVKTQQDLYAQIKQMPWEDYLDAFGTLAVDCVTFHKTMTHSLFVSQLSKDAVVDRFRDREGRRPSVDLISPDVRINVHLSAADEATVSLDSSGDSLFKRGYRLGAVEAPINEVLAAGLLAMTGWNADRPLHDPMCGSGTFLVEAAMKATQTPAGKYRSRFDFMKWTDFDETLWDEVKAEAEAKMVPLKVSISGADVSRRAVSMSQRNLQFAGFGEQVVVQPKDFFRTTEPFEGLLITNPPYDERIKLDDTAAFYRQMGDIFKNYYPGSDAWIITDKEEAIKSVGLKPSRKIKVFNGRLECRFLKYEMYRGTKKGGGDA